MPYDLKTKSGIVLRNIPDDISPDAPELKQLAQQAALSQVKPTTREDRIAQLKRDNPGEYDPDSAEWKKKYGPTMDNATFNVAGFDTGIPIGDKAGSVLANFGAGMANLGQGVKQLAGKAGIGPGVTDEQIQEKRRNDDELADRTTGGKLLQIAGEAAPTLVVPFGTFAKSGQLAARGIGGLAKATGRAAIEKGAQATAKALGQGTSRVIADSALAGAAGGALGPVTEDESRLGNAALGTTFGAAVPAAGRVIGAGYRSLTKKGAGEAAARIAQEAAGDDPAVLRRLRQYTQDQPDIPLTSSAVAQNEGLAQLEQGARARNGADFYQGDQDRARAVFEKVMGDTSEAEQLAARRANRSAEWNSNWDTASTLADPQVFASRVAKLREALDQAGRSAESSNPAVMGLINSVKGELERLGDDFAPGHMQQIRANLNGRGNPMSPNAYQAAPRESAAVGSIKSELDDILNDTTQGAWDAVKGGYADASRGVDASKAAGRVRGSFVDAETGRVRGTSADARGDVPMITESGLGKAIELGRAPDGSNLLSEQATQGLNKTLDALRRQGIVQRVKKSATAGGGSNTISDSIASGALDKAAEKGGGVAMWALGKVRDIATSKREAALLDALRDPEAMARLLQTAARAPGDLSPKEVALLKLLRSGGATGLSELTQSAPQQ